MKLMIIILIFTSILAYTTMSMAILTNLTEEHIKEAIKIGSSNNDVDMIYAQYTKYSGMDILTLGTPYLAMIVEVSYSIEKKENIEVGEVRAISKQNVFSITVGSLGYEKDFAKNYHVLVHYREKIIKPFFERATDSKFMREIIKRSLRGFKAEKKRLYQQIIHAFFSLEQIDPNGQIKVILKKDDGEKSFFFDLSKYK